VADQVTAATSVRPLPTAVPTRVLVPTPTQVPPQAALQQPFTTTRSDPAAPLRTAAAIAGTLAVLVLLATLIVRYRLRAATNSSTE
jgi:hypothetical protein